jgi:hypothetical protein
MAYTPKKPRKSHTHTHDTTYKVLNAIAATCVYTSWALVVFLVILTLANGL